MSDLSYLIAHESTVNWGITVSLWLCLALAFLPFPLAGRTSLAALRHDPRKALALLVFASALTARALLPASLMHENSHGYLYFSDAACGEPLRDLYGFAYFALHYPFFSIFGASFDTLFGVQILLSALQAPLLYRILRLLDWSAGSAAVAGMACAFSPVLMRFGASEDMFVPAIFFTLLSAERLLVWGAGGRLRDALGGIAALVLAVQSRPEMYLYAPLFTGLISMSEARFRARLAAPESRRVALFAAAFCLLFLAVPLHNFVWRILHDQQPAAALLSLDPVRLLRMFFNIGLRSGEAGNAVFDRLYTQPVLTLFGSVGMLLLPFARRAGAQAVFFLWVTALLIWMSVQVSIFSALRLQQWPVLLWCVAAAYGLELLLRAAAAFSARWGGRLEFAVPALFVVLLAAGLCHSGDLLRADYNQRREFEFLAKALESLPENSTVVIASGDRVVNSFFSECHKELASRNISVRKMTTGPDSDKASFRSGDIFYVGLPCYSFSTENEAAAELMRPECRLALEKCPLAIEGLSTLFANRPFDYLHVSSQSLRLEFLRCGE